MSTINYQSTIYIVITILMMATTNRSKNHRCNHRATARPGLADAALQPLLPHPFGKETMVKSAFEMSFKMG